MEKNLAEQLNIFLWSCAFGFCLGIIYDIFRFLRVLKFKSKLQIYIQDILFMCILGLCTFIFTTAFNFGQIRFYIILGEIIGIVSYRYTLGELTIRLFKFLYHICSLIFKFLESQLIKSEHLIINLAQKLFIKFKAVSLTFKSKIQNLNNRKAQQSVENQ